MKWYTGIGARNIPKTHIGSIQMIAGVLARKGWTLRSGAATGADTAFEQGCDQAEGSKEIYLPWKGFNDHPSKFFNPSTRASQVAAEHHPNYKRLGVTVKKFMARNSEQVLGELMYEPSSFVVCYTADGVESGNDTTVESGGTGQALRIATSLNIPIFNLKNKDAYDRVLEFVEQLEDRQ